MPGEIENAAVQPEAIEAQEESMFGRFMDKVGHVTDVVLTALIDHELPGRVDDKPIVVPEVSRGAFRVPFGTDPDIASEMARDYGRRKQILLEAAARRRSEA